ncbi:MAG: hypothetical protein ACKVG5_12335 [Acidimicrobiales bacterium]
MTSTKLGRSYQPDLIEINDMIYMFDGVEEPKTYGAQTMIFDYPDPNEAPPATGATTSSTTTTSALPSTTATAS